jgi:orotate phosphoribosyltransferase
MKQTVDGMGSDYRRAFIEFALEREVLRFGEFTTKAGRKSPYFFNAGLFNDGQSLCQLGEFYACAILESDVEFDMLFGPAYKGIPLVSAVAIALAGQGRNVPFCFNRKETKAHGEGGSTVGAVLAGRVLIVDDVISAGTSVRESVEIIRAASASPAGVCIALDRMERGAEALSATQEVQTQFRIPVISIASLNDLIGFVSRRPALAQQLPRVQAYRDLYGVEMT